EGSFTLSYKGQTTAPLLFAKNILENDIVRSALEALSTIGPGNVDVEVTHTTGSVNIFTDIKVSFRNALANGEQGLLTLTRVSGSNFDPTSLSVTKMANFGRITPNERQMFDTQAERDQIIA